MRAMPEVSPFCPLRYAKDRLADVIAPPYDVVTAADRARLAARSPHNVVHVDLPEGEGDLRYANAARILAAWRAEGVLEKDAVPCFLAYEQTFTLPGGAAQTRRGFLALVRLEPFGRGVLAHERTLSGPKVDRLKLFKATRTALSPVFLLYRDPEGAAWQAAAGASLVEEFETPDGTLHTLRRVADPDARSRAATVLSAHPLLVADGHHRYETALGYAGPPDPADRSAKRWVLAYLSNRDDPGLAVFATHRLIHSTGRADRARLRSLLAAHFDVAPGEGDASALTRALAEAGRRAPSVCAVWPDGEADLITLRAAPDHVPALARRPEVMRRLDVVVLHDAILEAALGIDAAALASQSFVRYPKDAASAVAEIRSGAGEVLFLMNATPVADVARTCEAGELLPQKSTYFYPKVPTGLCFFPLEGEI